MQTFEILEVMGLAVAGIAVAALELAESARKRRQQRDAELSRLRNL